MLALQELRVLRERTRDLRRRGQSLLDAAQQVVSFGVPLHHALAVIANAQRSCGDVAQEFIRLFLHAVWRPFTADGFPLRGWSEVSTATRCARCGPTCCCGPTS